MSKRNPVLLVQNAGFGETPVPADAFWQPGEEIGTASEDAPTEGVDAIVRAVVPVGVPVEYAIADQAKPPQPRPLMLRDRKPHKETLYVLFFPSLEKTDANYRALGVHDDGIRLFTQSQIAEGFRKAEAYAPAPSQT